MEGFDNLMLERGQLVGILGYKAKSWILQQLSAKALINKYKPLIFSAEMAEHNVLKRLIACLTWYPHKRFIRDYFFHDFQEFSRKFKDEFPDMHIISAEKGKINLATNLRKCCKLYQPDVVLIDYYQLIRES